MVSLGASLPWTVEAKVSLASGSLHARAARPWERWQLLSTIDTLASCTISTLGKRVILEKQDMFTKWFFFSISCKLDISHSLEISTFKAFQFYISQIGHTHRRHVLCYHKEL